MWSRRRLMWRLRRHALPLLLLGALSLGAVLFLVLNSPTSTTSASQVAPAIVTAPPLAVDRDLIGDDTPPKVSVSEVDPTATTGRYAAVSFESQAIDDRDGEIRATCVPASGSLFPVGTTVVTCVATDSAENVGVAQTSIEVVATGTSSQSEEQDQVLSNSAVAPPAAAVSTDSTRSPVLPIASVALVAAGGLALTVGFRRRDFRAAERRHRDRLRARR